MQILTEIIAVYNMQRKMTRLRVKKNDTGQKQHWTNATQRSQTVYIIVLQVISQYVQYAQKYILSIYQNLCHLLTYPNNLVRPLFVQLV